MCGSKCRHILISFVGVDSVLVKLYIGEPPFFGLKEYGIIIQVLKGGRPGRPLGGGRFHGKMGNRLWSFVNKLWKPHPQGRPNAAEAVHELRTIVESHPLC